MNERMITHNFHEFIGIAVAFRSDGNEDAKIETKKVGQKTPGPVVKLECVIHILVRKVLCR